MQQKVLSMMSPCSRCLQGPAILFLPRVLMGSPQLPRLELKSLCSDRPPWLGLVSKPLSDSRVHP